jgi:hypothetical protein
LRGALGAQQSLNIRKYNLVRLPDQLHVKVSLSLRFPSLSHTHPLSHALSLKYSLTHTRTHTYSLSHTLSLSLSHTLTHSLSTTQGFLTYLASLDLSSNPLATFSDEISRLVNLRHLNLKVAPTETTFFFFHQIRQSTRHIRQS